jgi:NTP pyrophosphatase (non-canonical NTP hydrolase)
MEKITELDMYQQEAIKTAKPMEQGMANAYFAGKLAEEAGEVISLVFKNYYHGKHLDVDKLKNECADALWYIANLANNNGFTLSEIATMNIEKLRARHGESYNKDFYQKG